MPTRKKTWQYNSPKPTQKKQKVPEEIKAYLQEKSDEIVEKVFKQEYLKPVPKEQIINHIVDIYTKWYRNCFYFCVKYQCPPNTISSFFESKFVKFEYLGDEKFQYSHMRHTGKWLPNRSKMTVDECLKQVTTEIPF